MGEAPNTPDRPGAQAPTMDDTSLAAFMCLSEEEAAIIIPDLTPDKRAVYERMASVCVDLEMGVVPEGVIVCRERRRG